MGKRRGRADFRNHGIACWCQLRGVSAKRNGPDVRADGRLRIGGLAEADIKPAKWFEEGVAQMINYKCTKSMAVLYHPSKDIS